MVKRTISIILMVCLIICICNLPLGGKAVYASSISGQNGEECLKAVIASTKYQFAMANNRAITDADELISYANYIGKGGAILIWDDVFDNDRTPGNTFSEDRVLADGNYILFQTKADVENQTDTLILYDVNSDVLETVTNRSKIFDLLDMMDKTKNDNNLQDGYGQTISKDDFMNGPSIKILLRNDKFLLAGSVSTLASISKANTSIKSGSKIAVEDIIISRESIALKNGEEYQLIATVIPYNAEDQNVRWSSDNNNVASVDGYGNITANRDGEAKITATTNDGGKTRTCQVSVGYNAGKNGNDPNSFNYKVGETASLYCAASYGTLTWVSSNTDIAYISNNYGQYCTIRCLKEGTATIIAYVDSSELLYDPVLKIFVRMPKREDYVHYTINVSR